MASDVPCRGIYTFTFTFTFRLECVASAGESEQWNNQHNADHDKFQIRYSAVSIYVRSIHLIVTTLCCVADVFYKERLGN